MMERVLKSRALELLIWNDIHRDVKCVDADYLVPAREWVMDECVPWVRKVFDSMHVTHWRDNHDCDDKSMLFKSLASVCHGQLKLAPQGLTVGYMEYTTRGGTRHAINMMVVDDNEICYFEPQLFEFVDLTAKEKQSIGFILF